MSAIGTSKSVPFAMWIVLAVFIVYLERCTGFATDDYVLLWQGLTQPLSENLLPKVYISVPVLHYTNGLAFFLIGDRPWIYELLKALYLCLCVLGAFSFLSLFCNERRSLAFALLFVLFPLHDTADYSFTAIYLLTSFCALLYAYVLAEKGHYKTSAIFAALGSFASYGSTPIVIGLSVLGWLRRQRMVPLCLLIPNAIYATYYVTTSVVLNVGAQRLTGEFGIAAIAKRYFLQLVTFADAALGPSAWLKIYYSLASLHVGSLMVGVGAAGVLIALTAGAAREAVDRRLLLAAVIILLGAFGIFALTGLYPQLAFSLGDRIMVYASFFLICLVVTLPMPRLLEVGVVVVLALAISGIASHWKDWNVNIERVAANIRNNASLRALPPGTTVYVSHNQYSRLGPYAHIDFFTANYVVRAFFQFALGSTTQLELNSFNRRLAYENGALLDRKYLNSFPVGEAIWLYDSENDALTRVPADKLAEQIDRLPDETRHWTQQLPDGWFKDHLLSAVPRLRYAY